VLLRQQGQPFSCDKIVHVELEAAWTAQEQKSSIFLGSGQKFSNLLRFQDITHVVHM